MRSLTPQKAERNALAISVQFYLRE